MLQIINTLATAGAEVLLGDLAVHFRRLGVCAEILCLTSDHFPLENRLIAEGVRVTHSNSRSPYSPLQVLAVRKQILAGRYDLIHSHLFPTQLWTCLGARMANRGVPLVTTEHNTWNRRRRAGFRALDRWMYSQYAVVACIGTGTESALQDWIGHQASTRVVPNGIDLERFTRASRQRSGKDAGARTIVICVASLSDRKGHEVLLEAVSQLPETELLLVGDGPRRAELERLAGELGIGERVRFLGVRNDVPEILANGDIYVQPSHWEGFGIAALEAMASGLPVVASNVAGLREVVGEAGLLFEAGSATNLRECLARLIADPDLGFRLGGTGAQRSQEFSIEATAVAYRELYKAVLGRA